MEKTTNFVTVITKSKTKKKLSKKSCQNENIKCSLSYQKSIKIQATKKQQKISVRLIKTY